MFRIVKLDRSTLLRGMPFPAAAGAAVLAFLAGTVSPAGAMTFSQFTSVNAGGDNSSAWSRTGARVYYSSRSGGLPYMYYKDAGAPVGQDGSRLTSWFIDEFAISISGDDQWAAMCAGDTIGFTHLWRCPALGGPPLSQMTYGPFHYVHPDWWGSGSSQEVAFATSRGGAGFQIWTLKPNGILPATQFTTVTGPGFEDLNPSFSPDGNSIVFSSNRAGGHQLFVSHRNGASWDPPVQLTSGGGEKSNPAWSPSGNYIAYQSGGGSETSLWLCESNGSNAQLITSTGAFDAEPSWSPGTDKLAFTSDRTGANYIWLAHQVSTPAPTTTWGRIKNAYR
ncbi:MAG: TolB family protein [Candidatus Eiseniibacteriota bacterium]